jgi:1,4-alpha-glucan branching enzyme
MIEHEPAKSGDEVKVTFILPLDGGESPTSVVGDFNDWNPTATPLRRRRGRLSATVTVAPGRRYAFRYLTEGGRWFNDDGADDYQPNAYGGSDSVLDLTAFGSS